MGHWYFIYLRLRRSRFKKVKISSADQTIFNKEYVRFDERGHKNIKPKPFLRPAMEMAVKKIFKKRKGGRKMTRGEMKPSYDHKKIVEEFEKWLVERIAHLDDEVDIKENRDIRVAEVYRIQNKFNSIKRKYMLLK